MATKTTIKIDNSKCVRCGRCVRVCALGILSIRDDVVTISNEERCMHCHHCYAACPTGALTLDNLNPTSIKSLSGVNVDSLLTIFENRYSCREFKNNPLPSDVFERLRRVLAIAPTGCNARATSYMIFDNLELTNSLRKKIAEKIAAADPEMIKADPFLRGMALMVKRGGDPILRGAPYVVISAHAEDAPTGSSDTVIGLAQFEVVAQAMGLGTCWCGIIPMAVAKVWPTIAEDLGFPQGYKISFSMLFGEKAFDYTRPVYPNMINFSTYKQ